VDWVIPKCHRNPHKSPLVNPINPHRTLFVRIIPTNGGVWEQLQTQIRAVQVALAVLSSGGVPGVLAVGAWRAVEALPVAAATMGRWLQADVGWAGAEESKQSAAVCFALLCPVISDTSQTYQ
jgi:hypothetical protein